MKKHVSSLLQLERVKYGLTSSYGSRFILQFTALTSSPAPRAQLPLHRFSISEFYLQPGALYLQSKTHLCSYTILPEHGPKALHRGWESCCTRLRGAGHWDHWGSARLQ